MGDEQTQGRLRDVRSAERGHGGEESELGDRAEGQKQFEVGLLERLPTADEHRQQTQGEQHLGPAGDVVVARCQAQDEVDSRLDHSRGMQIGAHRSGCCHGARQPEVERHERGLRDRSDEDEDDGGDDDAACVQTRLSPIDQGRELTGAGGGDEQDHPDEHGQTAGRGDDERLQGRLPRAAAGLAVPDEQVGEDGGAFPEQVEHEQFVGDDESVHHSGEGHEDSRESSQSRLVGREVACAVDEDEGADPGDQQRHDPGEHVEAEDSAEAEFGQPVEVLHHRLGRGAEDLGDRRQAPQESREGNEGEEEEGVAAEQANQRVGDDRCPEEGACHDYHRRPPPSYACL
jgi:hypothetical protein